MRSHTVRNVMRAVVRLMKHDYSMVSALAGRTRGWRHGDDQCKHSDGGARVQRTVAKRSVRVRDTPTLRSKITAAASAYATRLCIVLRSAGRSAALSSKGLEATSKSCAGSHPICVNFVVHDSERALAGPRVGIPFGISQLHPGQNMLPSRSRRPQAPSRPCNRMSLRTRGARPSMPSDRHPGVRRYRLGYSCVESHNA